MQRNAHFALSIAAGSLLAAGVVLALEPDMRATTLLDYGLLGGLTGLAFGVNLLSRIGADYHGFRFWAIWLSLLLVHLAIFYHLIITLGNPLGFVTGIIAGVENLVLDSLLTSQRFPAVKDTR